MQTRVFAILFVGLWPACATAADYDLILASYGQPELIAGLGQRQDVNGWLPAMEGTDALHVELSNTHMTMADAAGNLFLADKESHSILKITPDGMVHTVVGTHVPGNGGDAAQPGTSVALSDPNGLYVLPNGTVYILDLGNNKIRRMGTNGFVETVLWDPVPILVGRGLWVSADGTVVYYTAYHTTGDAGVVRRWTPTGGLSTYASGFAQPGNIDIDPTDGNLVVTDRGAHRVYRVYSDGSRTVIAGDGTTQNHGDGGPATNAGLDEVRGIAFLPHGGYFLATQGDGDIWYVEPNGIAHEFIPGSGSSTPLPHDGICEPRAVSVAPWGDLIITENDYAVIRVVRRKLAFSRAHTDPSTGLRMIWYSMPSADYAVQFTDSLTQTNWQTLAVTSGASADIISRYTDTNAPFASKGFYRVRRETP
jgi:streptogramin lyase